MKTADEILAKWEGYPGLSLNDDKVRTGRMRVIAAMKEFAGRYHKDKLKDELVKFTIFISKIDYKDAAAERVINEYLEIIE